MVVLCVGCSGGATSGNSGNSGNSVSADGGQDAGSAHADGGSSGSSGSSGGTGSMEPPNTSAGASNGSNAWGNNSAASNSAAHSGGSTGGATGAPGGGDGGVPAGVLTAGAWDDNRNYDFFNGYLSTNANLSGIPPVAQADRDQAHGLFSGNRPARSRLDIAIVIDTTGSMQDEAAYLSAEFQNISAAITAQFPNADQHWALVAYRDRPDTDPGDEYVVRSWDFTTDLASYQRTIGALTAANGGDYPEAPDIGLATANGLSWRTDPAVARLAFWVADAPQHDQYAGAMAQDFSDARAKGIHLYPISASGADELLEYTMRSGAQVTGGRYLFLTDDSGIGDPHLVPSIPCYFVTKLGKAIIRMASIELSGVYVEPAAADVIRTGGNPSAGQCSIGDGGVVHVF
jgi:hypothetical protein